MRLTLRTLLAWMDDVLPPDDRAALGDKVAASPVARQLVDRIRATVAQPGLPAPRLDGRGLAADADSVARYLDNSLPADQLEAFERVCLESDTHLGEVAGCHRILAHLAADPTGLPALDAAGRARVLAALKQPPAATPGPSERTTRAAPPEAAPRRKPKARSPSSPAGAGGTRRRWLAWGSASVAVLLVAALAGVLARSVIGGRDRADERQVAVAPAEPSRVEPRHEAVADRAAIEPDVAPRGQRDDEPGTAAARGAGPAVVPAGQPAPNDGVEPPPAAPAVEIAVANPVDSPLPAAAPAPPATVGGDWPVVWRAGGEAAEWHTGPPDTQIPLAAEIVAPPGTTPELTINDVAIRILPRSRVVLSLIDGGVPRLEMVWGRVVVRGQRPDAAVALAAAGVDGLFTGGIATGVAVEVVLERSAGDDPDTVPAVTIGRMVPLAAAARWSGGGDADGAGSAERVLEPRRLVSWDARDPTAFTIAAVAPPPPWSGGDVAGDRLERSAATTWRDRLAVGTSLDEVLAEMAAGRRVEDRAFAAETWALLGRFDELVTLLAAAEPPHALANRQWEMLEARSVPLALARGADTANRLRQALAARGPAGEADRLWRLACAFTPEEIAAGASGDLVAALDDDDLVVRRYALLRLVEAFAPPTVDRLRFRPDAPAERRRAGVDWWRRAVGGVPPPRGR